MRVLRRLGRGTLKAFLVVTVLSLTFNALVAPARTLPAPHGSDVVVDGVRVHYERWGSHGSPVVLVHGFAESTVSWRAAATRLARDHVVVALDLPGFGYSQHTGHYGVDDEAAVVVGFIQALHLEKPALVGHSLGAAVVGEVARTRPQVISGVIFADGDAMAIAGGGGRSVMAWVLRSPYGRSVYRAITRWTWLDEKIVRAQCGSRCSHVDRALVREWMRPLTQGEAETSFADMASQGMMSLTPEAVRSIRTPRGIIWGSEDSSGGGSLAGAQADLGHPRTIVLDGAAHLSMTADPEGFAAAVRTIIGGWPR